MWNNSFEIHEHELYLLYHINDFGQIKQTFLKKSSWYDSTLKRSFVIETFGVSSINNV